MGIISDYIKTQMKEQMKKDENIVYFLVNETTPFKKIKKDQTYFIDENKNLIIAFDEYKLGPGFMGHVEFTIPDELIKAIRKQSIFQTYVLFFNPPIKRYRGFLFM